MQSVRVLIKAVLSSPSSSFRPFQSKDKQTKATPYPTLIVELAVYVVGLGFIFRLPPVMVTFTKRRVYVILFFARPLGVFFFSWGSTLGVCDLTLPARAREPWTLPMLSIYGDCWMT